MFSLTTTATGIFEMEVFVAGKADSPEGGQFEG